ncbi:hypothetical protein FIA58_018860 [Flavobacterium jejuense]|uniref:Uncharacterized protein n=1 Tax=Flavobacterium jejuense TaxID=1544455 RepID=A0ABX0IYV8_9FLAO|nr:DUF5074 domain-containing protein [Flavobacterium jejuense]NHN27748.1 hypothetical protein [Flavobacterium jejuense]
MKLKKLYLLAFISSTLFFSCSSDDDVTREEALGAYENGIIVLNEGNFGTDNSEISFVSNDFSIVKNNVFNTVNTALALGDTGQDIGFYNNLAFIVLNNSQKIEVVDRYTMIHVATISSGLINPRYITFANGKGYVTNWGDGGSTTDDYIAVVDLTNYVVSSTIPVVEGPERILHNNNKLYVAHKGGYGQGNSVSVIDLSNNSVVSVTVGDVPNSLELVDNSLYVLCGGAPSWSATETTGELVKINILDNTTESKVFNGMVHPSNLDFESNNFYYTIDSKIYKMGLSDVELPNAELFSTENQGAYGIYSFAVNNDKIYIGDAKDYSSNGEVYAYSLTGTLLNSFIVGVSPSGIYFNN